MKTLFAVIILACSLSVPAFAGSSTDPATIGGGGGHYPTGQEPSSSNHSNLTPWQTLTCQGCHQGNTSKSFSASNPNNCGCQSSGKH
jgi:hypothetical protein